MWGCSPNCMDWLSLQFGQLSNTDAAVCVRIFFWILSQRKLEVFILAMLLLLDFNVARSSWWRLNSCGMWRRVLWKVAPYVSGDRTAFSSGSNKEKKSLGYLTLNMKELRPFKSLGSTCRKTRRHIPVELCFQNCLLHKMKRKMKTEKLPHLTTNLQLKEQINHNPVRKMAFATGPQTTEAEGRSS